MNKEMKEMSGRFFFLNVVISCVLLFLCGSVTVAQRTAYNTYFTQYAVLSMKSEGEKIRMEGLEKEIAVSLPEKSQLEKAVRYLKLTPLASTVFFFESIHDLTQEISDKAIDMKAN